MRLIPSGVSVRLGMGILAAACIAACGSGGNVTTPPGFLTPPGPTTHPTASPTPSPTPTPTPSPTPAPGVITSSSPVPVPTPSTTGAPIGSSPIPIPTPSATSAGAALPSHPQP